MEKWKFLRRNLAWFSWMDEFRGGFCKILNVFERNREGQENLIDGQMYWQNVCKVVNF